MLNIANTLRLTCCAIALFGVGLEAQSAHAAKREIYTVDWDIAPVSGPTEPVWVKPYSSFAQGKMLVKARFVLDGDAITATGRKVADADGLIVATNFSKSLGCMLTLPGERDVLPVNAKRNAELGCLLDSDADGRFDQFFKRSLFIGDFTWNQSALPKKMEAITPVSYRRETGPGSMVGIPIYVQYGWFAGGIDRLIFQICNRPNLKGGLSCLAPDIRVKQSDSVRIFDALGGRFEVIEKIENRLQIRQIAPIGGFTLSVRRF